MVVIDRKFEDSAPRPKTEPVYDPNETVASVLRRTRDDLGQDLRTVAEVLRIRHAYLEAIEDGAYDRLPGATYAAGFLRTYADFLGLDGNEMVGRFKGETESAQRKKTDLDFPDIPSELPIPRVVLLLVPALILAAAIGAWFVWPIAAPKLSELFPTLWSQPNDVPATADDPGEDDLPEEAPPTPASAATAPAGAEPGDRGEAVSKPRPAPPAQPAAKTAPPTTRTTESVPPPKPQPLKPGPQAVETAPRGDAESPAPRTPAQTPAQTTSQTTSRTSTPSSRTLTPIREEITVVEIPTPPRVQAISRPSDGPVSRVYGQQGPDTRIVIRATQESWVQVRNRFDVPLITRVLRAGDTYYVPNRDGLTLVTGNAGGLEIEVDSVRLPPLGSVGAIRRQIALDPTKLLAGTAVAQ